MPARSVNLEKELAANGLPSSVSAEKAVLGSVLLDTGNYHHADKLITADDFHADAHRRIYRAMQRLAKANEPIDFITLADELRRSHDLDAVGGAAYVTSLTDGLPRKLNVEHHAKIVKEYAVRRTLLAMGNDLMQSCMESGRDTYDLLADVQSRLANIGVQDSDNDYEMLANIGMQRVDELARLRKETTTEAAVVWGIEELDEMVASERGDLIVLGGLSGSGKSGLALQVIDLNCGPPRGLTALIFSLEMTKRQNVDRILAHHARVSYSGFRRPRTIADQKMTDIVDACIDHVTELKVGVTDNPVASVDRIMSTCQRFKMAEGGLDLVVVDHAQIIEGRDERRGNRATEVDTIVRDLKRAAKVLNVTILLLSQMSKHEGRPKMQDFKESGGVYQHADVAMIVYRPFMASGKPEDRSKDEIMVVKNRHGGPGDVPVAFVEATSRFQ